MMLKVANVNKSFSGKAFSLNDITLELPAGYICGLIGENAAGKSTLIKVICGLYKQDDKKHGKLEINGFDLRENEAKAKESIGIILDEAIFDNSLTLEKIGRYYGEFYELYNHAKYISYLQKFHLDSSMRLKKLSKGTAIKVQLAFALSHDAKLLIFDEPTAGLDKKFREEFLNICMGLVEDGTRSVFISSHITEDLDRIADYIAYLQEGELLFFDTKENICDKFRLVSGEKYKCNLIRKERIIHIEEGEYSTTALVLNKGTFPEELDIKVPNIKEIMYYFVKGGKKHAKDICERIYS